MPAQLLKEMLKAAIPNDEERVIFVDECLADASKRELILDIFFNLRLSDNATDTEFGFRPALGILHLAIIAESMVKRTDVLRGSKARFKKFFDYAINDDKIELARRLRKVIDTIEVSGTLDASLEILYGVRCGVVHDGNYFSFSMCADCPREGRPGMISTYPDGHNGIVQVETSFSYQELRAVFLRTAVNLINIVTRNRP